MYYPGICLRELRKATKDLSQSTWILRWNSNRISPKHKSKALPLDKPVMWGWISSNSSSSSSSHGGSSSRSSGSGGTSSSSNSSSKTSFCNDVIINSDYSVEW
jgi:hypothetical protein